MGVNQCLPGPQGIITKVLGGFKGRISHMLPLVRAQPWHCLTGYFDNSYENLKQTYYPIASNSISGVHPTDRMHICTKPGVKMRQQDPRGA